MNARIHRTRGRAARLAAAGLCAIACATTSTATAGADANPNQVGFGPVTCPDIGRTFDAVELPSANAKPGHVVGSNLVGVATSLYLVDAAGDKIAPLFDRPGKGLDAVTVWCFWPFPGSPTGYIGGDILFRADAR